MRRLAAVLLLLAVLAGCSSNAERLYRRAEAFLAQGQVEMAADEYRRLAREHPRSPLADDALYKLAYLYAEEMDRPSAALIQYRALADTYPSSPYADDALMRVMAIQREALGDPGAVKVTWEELRERFDDRRELCARGMLEVARAYFEAEQYALAAATAGDLRKRYPRQESECAQAALLSARASERTGGDPAEVERLFEEVIEGYPDSHAAAMAKRSIGRIMYERREEDAQQRAEELQRRSRLIDGVPAHASRDGELLQALAALRSALAHRGERRSLEELVAFSGAAFTIVFDPQQPALGRRALEESPFEVVAEILGFADNVWSGTGAEQAFETVHQALLQGHPVLVRHGSAGRWVIVTGYDMTKEQVSYLPPAREGYASMARDRFLEGWKAASGSGSGVAGPQRYYQFSLGARMDSPGHRAVLEAAVRRAAEVMRLRTVAGAPAGANAWEQIGAHLELCMNPETPGVREQALRWREAGLQPHLTLAAMGTAMLRHAADTLPGAGDIGERHQELVQEATLLGRKIDEAAESGEAAKWQAAAAQANYVAALHIRLAEDLADAAGG
ncbi:MAG: tetratricopeptide repeat protein [Armatimonadota bacterium]|nr:tetratricopeptide repeat protein [Armatimonadota bacterium]